MPRTTQLTLSLVSRPGTLATLARTLADAGVNITALSAAEVVRPREDPARWSRTRSEAKRALRKAKYRVTEEPAFALRLRNKPGALARVAARLAKERINVRSIYATTGGPRRRRGRPDRGRQPEPRRAGCWAAEPAGPGPHGVRAGASTAART